MFPVRDGASLTGRTRNHQRVDAPVQLEIDQLSEGDTFLIYTLNETLTYEVDQINIVLPSDMSTLGIEPGKDLVTLFTCTPYGINTHRLMVRAHRVENASDSTILVTAEALQLDETGVALCIGVPMLFVILIGALIMPQKKHGGLVNRL